MEAQQRGVIFGDKLMIDSILTSMAFVSASPQEEISYTFSGPQVLLLSMLSVASVVSGVC